MPIKSMTGFARCEAKLRETDWLCEIKSVNGRNLDLRLRLPEGCDFLESMLRQEISKIIRRGSVSLTLSMQKNRNNNVEINSELLNRLVDLKKTLGASFDQGAMRFEQLLSIPGVLSYQTPGNEDAQAQAQEIWQKLIQPCLDGMEKSRAKEGDYLKSILLKHLDAIAALVKKAEARIAPQAEGMKKKLHDQLAAVSGGKIAVDEQRVAQELAILAIKADVREELDRLHSHIQAAQDTLKIDEAIGRRLDFLAQEFNREANTLCAKSSDIDLTKIGLELKNIIDQFREQVQNIE